MSGEPEEDDPRGMEYDRPEDDAPGFKSVTLDNGMTLPIALMMDKDMNPTEIPFDTRTILAGSAQQGWFEIDVQEGTWESITFH